MKTASFFSFFGQGRVSIARSAPRQIRGFRIYKSLAPASYAMLQLPYEPYRQAFFEQLAALDPEKVWGDLHALVAPHEPVLLCWERPPLTESNWCHRRMVALWLEETLGEPVPELEPRSKLK